MIVTLLAQKQKMVGLPKGLVGLAITAACLNGIAHVGGFAANASELNGFRLESQSDGSLSVQVQADSLPAYDIEPSGNGVSILLKDTHLSDSLRQKGMPVVIDNRNRAIGRAVPGEGNTVKIVIPNWKPEQGALHVKADTGTSSVPETSRGMTPRPRYAPTEGLSGAFESQFKSAAKALARPSTASSGMVTALPAVENTEPEASSTWRQAKTPSGTSSSRRKKVTYRPVAAATALPKVVTFAQAESTSTAPNQSAPLERSAPMLPSSYSATNSPRAATPWPVVAQPVPTPESTGWGSYNQATLDNSNPYGIDSIADAASASQASEPSVGMGAQLKQFFDGITGNRFSRPYGVAFWAMMIGVVFVACLGFLALAIGLLCTRLVFTPFGNPLKKSNTGLFSWRLAEESSPISKASEEEPITTTPLRGPVAKRFPFVASGLSQSVAMYTPQKRETSLSPVTSRPVRERSASSEGIGLRRCSAAAESESPLATTSPQKHESPVWRPYVSAVQGPITPALVAPQSTAPTVNSRLGWVPPEDDGDLISPSIARPASPVERALYRLTR